MKIVTSGLAFLDIDAYAGIVAYAELLKLQGIEAVSYSSATMNASIPPTVRSWDVPLITDYEPTENDTFVVIDVSEPHYLDRVVDVNRVEEVIDHHLGNEAFWGERIGSKATIEFVGAACTQIYERWVNAGLVDQMSETSARLLISGILDNTLNFKAKVTTKRDHRAYDELLKLANFPDDWTARYFKECEDSIFANIQDSLVNDTKTMEFPNLNMDMLLVGQLVIWDADRALTEYRNSIETTMSDQSEEWLVNIVSIKDGKSFFLTPSSSVKSWLEATVNVKFIDHLAQADRLWLRKEIMKRSISLT